MNRADRPKGGTPVGAQPAGVGGDISNEIVGRFAGDPLRLPGAIKS